MSLTETKIIDQITVTENGVILYREATRILRDGEQIAQTFHRTSLTPGQDLQGQPQQVQNIAELTWTPEVVQAYIDQLAQQGAQQ